MITRRLFVGGGCVLCATAATAEIGIVRAGCALPADDFARRVEATKATIVSYTSPNSSNSFGSGMPEFDRALAVTLLNLSKTFSVLPGFAFSERVTMNAFASNNTVMGKEDGSVVFGKSLFRAIMSRRENPELGVAAVCAHEFAHIVQFKRGLYEKLVVNGRVKRLELHADFLTGWFAGKRKLEVEDFPAAVFAATQYSFGDHDYGSKDHHGTHQERGAAVVAGFNSAYRSKESFVAGIETGLRYVARIPL